MQLHPQFLFAAYLICHTGRLQSIFWRMFPSQDDSLVLTVLSITAKYSKIFIDYFLMEYILFPR